MTRSGRRAPNAPGQGRPHGFTLVELLIALTLLGLVMVAVYGGLRLGTRASAAGEERAGRTEELRVVEQFIRRQLSQAYPLQWNRAGHQKAVFKGNPQGLYFAALLPAHRGVGGLYLLSIKAALGSAERRLLFSYRLARPDILDFETRSEADQHVVLVKALASVDWSYYGPTRTDEEPRWQASWDNADALPRLVRLKITKGEPPRRWPDLVIPIRAQLHPGEPQLVIQRPEDVGAAVDESDQATSSEGGGQIGPDTPFDEEGSDQ